MNVVGFVSNGVGYAIYQDDCHVDYRLVRIGDDGSESVVSEGTIFGLADAVAGLLGRADHCAAVG